MTQAINLANFSNSLDSSGGVAPSVLNAPVPYSKGGLSTTTLADAIALIGSALFPVGSIYTNATNGTSPTTLLGFGVWAVFGSARVLIGDGGGYTATSIGGSADAYVVTHTHSASTTISDPGHRHLTGGVAEMNPFGRNIARYGYGDAWTDVFNMNGLATGYDTYSETKATGITASTSLSTVGSSGTNGNLQPYVVVYMWRRTS